MTARMENEAAGTDITEYPFRRFRKGSGGKRKKERMDMDLAGAYREIEERLSRIDFPLLFRRFHRFPFAVYDETRAYIDGEMIDKPAGFIANTSVLFRGKHTAIWDLTGNTKDFDTLTSKIVHEMLHAYQNASGETRWADERAALVKYRYEAVNVSARLEEADAMDKCISADAPEAFSRLLALRRARADRFPAAYDYESRVEQIEGSAHFVELAALARLDPEKAALRRKELFSELSDPARYFPVRAVTYLSGAAFIACLRKYTSFDTDAFTDTPFSVAAIAGAAPCALPEAGARVCECMDDWYGKTRALIEKTIEKGELVLEGNYRLFAFNVYDALWDGRYAVLTGFIGYIEGTAIPATDEELFSVMKMLNGDFVARLDEDMLFTRLWRQ